MIRLLALVALSSSLAASDVLHVPLACKYAQASHAIAGVLVGAVVNNVADSYRLTFVPRLVASTVAALAAGTFKEYLIDKRARPSEIPAWGVGGAVVSLAWSFKW